MSFPDSNTLTTVGSLSYIFTLKESIFYSFYSLESSFYYGFVYFRQQRDSNINRGFLQKSVVVISKNPYIHLFSECSKIIGTQFFIAYDLGKEFSFEKSYITINNWKIEADNDHDFVIYDKKIKYRQPIQATHRINSTTKRKSKTDYSLKERLSGRKYTFQEVNINSVFNNMEYLFKLWELTILGEPILIYSPNPEICSNAVLTALCIISPLSYAGDFRTYFTVHNHEFKEFSKYGESIGFQTQSVIGFTNPFFLKSFEKWPHIICIGKTGGTPTSKTFNFFSRSNGPLSSSPDSRKQLLWEYKDMIWSKHDFVIKYDTTLEKKNVEHTDKELTHVVNNVNIIQYFESLTEMFLDPLEKCFDKIWTGMNISIIRSEHHKIFKAEKFYNYICQNGFKEKIFSGTKSEVEDFYKKFIYSSNFRSWLNNKLKEAYCNDMNHLDTKFLIKGTTQVGLIDLYMKLNEEIKDEKKNENNESNIKKLQLFMEDILSSLPKDLQESLKRNIHK